ncbi:MAG: Na-translocating system protein MpsC family protein [Thermoactinomyces sp.]
MKINFLQQYQQQICNAYRNVQYQLFGKKCTDVDAIIYKNNIIIISKDELNTPSRMIIRGRRVDPSLNEMKQMEYHTYMKSVLSNITGHHVVCSKFNIFFSNGVIMDVFCMDGEIGNPVITN